MLFAWHSVISYQNQFHFYLLFIASNISGPTKKRNTSSSSIVSNGKGNTPTPDRVVQPCTQNKKSILDASDDCTENNNQPDVIKAASAADKNVTTDLVSVQVSKDIENLQQENEQLDNQLKRHALGFEAMATLVDYLANHCGVVGVMDFNNKLKQDVMNLQYSLQNKKLEIGR